MGVTGEEEEEVNSCEECDSSNSYDSATPPERDVSYTSKNKAEEDRLLTKQ